MPVSPVPAGYHTVTPYLIIEDAAAALEFYVKAFGAEVKMSLKAPDGTVAHAEILIGDSMVMISEAYPNLGFNGPQTLGGTSVLLHLYVESADAGFDRAVLAGCTVVRPLQDQFYGDRSGTVLDPFGHIWTISSHIEDVSADEMTRRMSTVS